jgi:2-dehydro-3-deoxyphosphogluconate aldolase/(4S)-4-hydroxy-2-oxoglutarate aldolase
MSWTREKALELIREIGLIPIVRAPSPEDALRAAEAIIEGGIGIAEITMTVPNAIRVMERVTEKFGDKVLLGAGTILDPETCRAALLAGAEFIVTPSLDVRVIETARRYSKACIPGALTPTEVVTAWQAGADMVKIFPCGPVGGPSYIKALKGPFPQIDFVPTGGVNLETTPEFIKAGAAAVAVGGELVNLKVLQEGKLDVIAATARKFVEAVRAGRAALASAGRRAN